jgi:hypothetical protein
MCIEKSNPLVIAAAFAAIFLLGACSEKPADSDVSSVSTEPAYIPVTADNYIQAETDWNFAAQQAQAPINTWIHNDRVTEDNQTIIRSNADVVYSLALVDVSESATFSIPKRANGALQMIHYMDENHLTHGVIYAGESVTITPDDLTSGNYVYILARTQISDDMEETKAAQRSMVIDAKSSKPYQSKGFDPKEVVKFRGKLIDEVSSGKATIIAHKAFGATLDDLDYDSYYYASAIGWGGLPPAHAQYTPFVKGQGSDAACQTIVFPKPNLDYENGGFYSLTTYNAESWIEGDNFYIGHKRMKDNGDGTVTIDFNCDTPHSVTVNKGWSGSFRFYKPVDVEETIAYVNHLMTIEITSVKESSSIQTKIPEIDSSEWATDPVKYGMTAMEYINAESHAFMNEFAINREVGLNSFFHFTTLAKAADKWVVSPSLDHLYSVFVIDTSKPFTVIVPDNDGRFVSLHMQDENHTFAAYKVGPGKYSFEPSDFDTRYVLGGVRIASDGTKENIDHIVNELQPQLQVIGGGDGLDSIPKPDLETMMTVRTALIVEYDKLDDTFETITYKIEDVKDWEKTTYTIAGAFALSPEDTAMYPAYSLEGAVGGKCYEATYVVPPMADKRGYFSITVYGEDKYLMSDEYNIVSSNHATTKFNNDNTFTIHFGAMECKEAADAAGVNFAYTPTDHWGFLMRVYLPDVEKMKKYEMPEIKEVK